MRWVLLTGLNLTTGMGVAALFWLMVHMEDPWAMLVTGILAVGVALVGIMLSDRVRIAWGRNEGGENWRKDWRDGWR